MTGRTDFIKEAEWADILTIWYVVVDEAYQALEHGGVDPNRASVIVR